MPGRCGPFDNGAAVRERAEVLHLVVVRAGNRQPRWIGTGREEQRTIRPIRSVVETHRPPGRIDRYHATAEDQLDTLLHVEVIRPERDPIVLRFTGEEVLRQVRPIDGWISIGADQKERSVVPLAPEHLGRGHACRSSADDDDR
jgi:hypothetical protein